MAGPVALTCGLGYPGEHLGRRVGRLLGAVSRLWALIELVFVAVHHQAACVGQLPLTCCGLPGGFEGPRGWEVGQVVYQTLKPQKGRARVWGWV